MQLSADHIGGVESSDYERAINAIYEEFFN